MKKSIILLFAALNILMCLSSCSGESKLVSSIKDFVEDGNKQFCQDSASYYKNYPFEYDKALRMQAFMFKNKNAIDSVQFWYKTKPRVLTIDDIVVTQVANYIVSYEDNPSMSDDEIRAKYKPSPRLQSVLHTTISIKNSSKYSIETLNHIWSSVNEVCFPNQEDREATEWFNYWQLPKFSNKPIDTSKTTFCEYSTYK